MEKTLKICCCTGHRNIPPEKADHTLYEIINAGELKAFTCGKQYRIKEQDLEDYITRNQVA